MRIRDWSSDVCSSDLMKAANVPIVFGPGRHEPSGSIFLYFLDPDGMTAEYSFGMEEFDEVGAREPRELEAKPEVLDTWGSVPDPRFGKGGDRKSVVSGKGVSVRVDLGGRRSIKKKNLYH